MARRNKGYVVKLTFGCLWSDEYQLVGSNTDNVALCSQKVGELVFLV